MAQGLQLGTDLTGVDLHALLARPSGDTGTGDTGTGDAGTADGKAAGDGRVIERRAAE